MTLGYALFLWLNLGTDGPSLREQARRIRLFCSTYGTDASEGEVIEATIDAVAANIERLWTARRIAELTGGRSSSDGSTGTATS